VGGRGGEKEGSHLRQLQSTQERGGRIVLEWLFALFEGGKGRKKVDPRPASREKHKKGLQF